MKVLNIHSRTIDAPKFELVKLLKTLATQNDMVWPTEHWPAMKFTGGIEIGAKGGHGPIRYSVEKYDPNSIIQFRFLEPLGFNGIHKFEVKELPGSQTKVTHTIDMELDTKGTFIWFFAVKSLHNALVEDGLDKLGNHFSEKKESTGWNLWVRTLRRFMTRNKRG